MTMSGFGGSRLLLCPSATASKARARATCAAGALCDRPSRDRATRSASRNGRSGSFGRLDIGHLAIRQSAIMAHRKASDPLVVFEDAHWMDPTTELDRQPR